MTSSLPPASADTPRPSELPLPPLPDNPRMPVDGGLGALGLVALAASSIGGVLSIYLFVMAVTFGFGGMRGGILPMLVLFATSLVRTGFHIGVARAATKRRPDVGDAARRYLVVSGIHTAVTLGLLVFVWLGGALAPGMLALLLVVALFLMGWPITLWMLANRPIVKRTFNTMSTFDVDVIPADRGVGAAGVLMTVFAALFLAIDLSFIAFLTGQDGGLSGASLLWLGVLVLFAVRSALHLAWGIRALRGRMDFGAFQRATQTYLWLGLLTVVVALGAMFATEELRMAFRKAPVNIIFVAVVIATALLAWPACLRAYAVDAVPFWDAEADQARPFRPAVDRGLTALGYLHLWFAVFGITSWFANAVGVGAAGLVPGVASNGTSPEMLLGLLGGGLQLWVALELIGMTARYQLAATIYGAVALGLTVLDLFVLRDVFGALEGDLGKLPTIMIIMSAVTSLVMPTVTFALSRGKPPLTM